MADSAVTPLPPTTASSFIGSVIGKPVIVKLTSGLEYRGVLTILDGFLNVALEQCFEYDGAKKRQLGDCLIRGNNIMFIAQS